MPEESKAPDFNFWGMGMSRLLRYSYPGFLLLVLSALFFTDQTTKFVAALGFALTALAALVLGAGVYVLHRSFVIPVHHGTLVGLLCLFDACRWKRRGIKFWQWKRCGIGRGDSLSPTRFLGSVGVKWPFRMLAYSTLRRSALFPNAEKLDI